MSRYIPYARKYFKSEEWLRPRKFSDQEAWLDMIFLASFAEHEIVLHKSKDERLKLYRGEFYLPQRLLAQRWGWSLSTLQRYFARELNAANPRIAKIQRGSHFGSENGSKCGSEYSVITLCNYDTYNSMFVGRESKRESRCGSQNEVLNNKGYNNKGDKNTHTQYSCLEIFTHTHEAHAHTPEQMCEVASAIREQVQRGELPEYKSIDEVAKGMIWLYAEYPELMQRFKRPCTRQDFQTISQMCEVEDVKGIVEALANKLSGDKPLNSFLATFKQWAALDYRIKDKARLGNPRYSKLL